MIELYGLRNCDSCRAALKWLAENGETAVFHDLKTVSLDERVVRGWIDALGWETVINKRGTTWRKLPEQAKTDIDPDKAVALILENLSLIKRPLVEAGGVVSVGFTDELRDRIAAL
ncbi:MAG: Spx/MgsR family RNA polymerase-binding regulatory protein [Alphaproteobacteria bacterium]|nr:Spx/MgsR family RNA polymerase-binding regulatory protein [Alphaproteobacteria bacterium]